MFRDSYNSTAYVMKNYSFLIIIKYMLTLKTEFKKNKIIQIIYKLYWCFKSLQF